MAISPIETAAFLPKSQEASFQKQQAVEKPLHEQNTLQASMLHKEIHDSARTVMAAKSDQPEYRYDGSSGNGKGMLYKKNHPKKQKVKEQSGSDRSEQGFDIRI